MAGIQTDRGRKREIHTDRQSEKARDTSIQTEIESERYIHAYRQSEIFRVTETDKQKQERRKRDRSIKR